MEQKFVETISGINVSNGVVKIYFINEDEKNLADGLNNASKNNSNNNSSQSDANNNENTNQNAGQKLFMKHDHTLIMPVAGFMYMVSVIKNLLDNEQMQKQIEKYIEAGLLPKLNPNGQEDDQEEGEYDWQGQQINQF